MLFKKERLREPFSRRTFLKILPPLVFGSAELLTACARQNPEELYKSFLTTPLKQGDLPPGFTVKGISAGNLDATAQAFKAVGQVNALVAENNPMLGGRPNGGISYTIFPSSKEAEGTYAMLSNRAGNRPVKDLGYPAIVFAEQQFFASVTVCATSVDNVLVAVFLTRIGGDATQQPKTISLTKAGIEHLKRVKR